MVVVVLASRAGDERIQRFDPMDQPPALQEAQRTIDRWRHDPRSFALHRLKKTVGADRLPGLNHKIEHLAARLGQTPYRDRMQSFRPLTQ